MKKSQKIILIIGITVGILLTTVTVKFLNAPASSKVTANVFSDIGESPYQDAISFMKTNGIVMGYSDGTYKPDSEINRAEFTKILMQTAFPEEIETYTANSCFSDVKTSDWFSKYVCLAKDKEIISGYSDGTFRPAQNINVPESLKISLEALNKNGIPDATGEWYQKYLNLAYSNGYMISEWSDMSKMITRGEMAQFIYQIKAPEAPAKNISISFQDETIDPLSVISIKGEGFDPLAATSVVFTTVQGNGTYIIPAINVTSDTVEVSVPLVNYDESQNLFTGANTSMKVIQIRTRGEDAFAITTSNEINDLLITTQQQPAIYESNVIKDLPTGALSAAFIAASLDSLNATAESLPATNTELNTSLEEAKAGLEDLLTKVDQISKYQGRVETLNTSNGTEELDINDLAKLDAIYAAFLGELEAKNMISFEDNSWDLISTAYAEEMNECMKQVMGGNYPMDAELQKFIAEPCQVPELMKKQHEKGAELLPDAPKVVWGFPLAISGIMLGPVAESLAIGKVAQIALSAGYSYLVEAATETKKAVSNAATAIAKAISDHKLGVPFLESGLPVIKFLYTADKALNPNETAAGRNQAIVPKSDTTSTKATIIKTGQEESTLISLNIPSENQSKVLSQDGTDITVSTPTPAPETTPAPAPDTTPGTEVCFFDTDCTNPEDVCNQGVCGPYSQIDPVGELEGFMTLTSATCIHKDGEETYYNKGYYVQTSGTMRGPVGTNLEWSSGDGPEECGTWHRSSEFYGPCIRQEGDPEESTWTLTQPAHSDSWWYEILLIAKDDAETYQRIAYGDVCSEFFQN